MSNKIRHTIEIYWASLSKWRKIKSILWCIEIFTFARHSLLLLTQRVQDTCITSESHSWCSRESTICLLWYARWYQATPVSCIEQNDYQILSRLSTLHTFWIGLAAATSGIFATCVRDVVIVQLSRIWKGWFHDCSQSRNLLDAAWLFKTHKAINSTATKITIPTCVIDVYHSLTLHITEYIRHGY